jgi:K+-transporting ATPase ATPase C chain
MTIFIGFIYTGIINVIAQIFFPAGANGSLIRENNNVIGSELIGQKFTSDKYFWSRPSAIDYDPMPSGASNLGPTSQLLQSESERRERNFIKDNFLKDTTKVPDEMIFESASGVDPDISPESAYLQVDRILKARNFNILQRKKLLNLIADETVKPFLGFIGEARVNVLLLNIKLDKIK